MLGQREMTMEDVTGILRRGWLYITIPFVLGPVIALAIAYFLPAKYTSVALIMVEGQKVPDSVVKSVVQESLIARITAMQELVTSRSKLEPLIDKYAMYRRDVAHGVAVDDLVAQMRSAITVTPVSSVVAPTAGANTKVIVHQDARDQIPGFTVGFTYDKPKIAQEVCSELVSGFVQADIVNRGKMAEETTNFLGNQLQEAKRKLDDQDAKMMGFQKKYAGALPDDERNNLAMLESISTRLDAVTQALQRAQQEKTYTESLLAEQVSYWDALRTGNEPSQSTDKEIAGLEDRLAAAEARYTPDHPDILKLKATIAELKKSHDSASAASASDPGSKGKSPEKKVAPAGVEPTDVQKLRSQVHGLDEAIAAYRRDQADLAQRAKGIEGRLQMSPLVQAQYKAMSRDYKTAMDFYNDLLAKNNNSGMATDLERGAQGEQFTVVNSPSLPDTPSFPVYWMFAAGGVGGGLALGLAIVVLREFNDKAIRTERDIEFFLELPTLVLLPSVGAIENRKNGRFRFWRGNSRKANVDSRTEQPVQA